MIIILMVINDYYINSFDEYFIGGYWCLLTIIILMAISGYSIVNNNVY